MTVPPATARPPGGLERLVRGALAASAVALPGGVVAAQYVGAQLFAYLTPFVVAVLVAGVYAVLGTGLGFVLERSEGALDRRTLLPYAAAVVGVLLWTVPPRSGVRDGAGG